MNDWLLDIRYGLRGLWKPPAFTLVATLILMVGIGANVLVFGIKFLIPTDKAPNEFPDIVGAKSANWALN